MIVGAGALDGPHFRNDALARGVEGAAPYSFSATNSGFTVCKGAFYDFQNRKLLEMLL